MTEKPSLTEDIRPMDDTTQSPGANTAQDDNIQAFAALGLGAEALHAISDLGFGAPTPVQLQAIPLLLAGRDVIAQAPTGTGKTAAFGLPIVERLDRIAGAAAGADHRAHARACHPGRRGDALRWASIAT